MDPGELMRRLVAAFLEELEDGTTTFERDLLSLERAEPGESEADALLESLMRTAHKLKGASRAVDAEPVERACHLVEDVFSRVRAQRTAPGADTFELLLAVVDALREAGARLRAGETLAGSALAGLLPALSAVAAGAEGPAGTPRTDAGPVEVEALPAGPPGAGAPPGGVPSAAPEAATLRIPAARLDRLLSWSAELIAVRTRLDARIEELGALGETVRSWASAWRDAGIYARRLGEDPAGRMLGSFRERIGRVERESEAAMVAIESERHILRGLSVPLVDELVRLRMVPFREAAGGLERTARDVARARAKRIDLFVEGGDLEIDRGVVEALRAPLQQLVRNAVDHGIEPSGERQAAGKPGTGRITVSASLRGREVDVAVEDDGRGLDVDEIRRHAERMSIPVPKEEGGLESMIFRPGLTTAPELTGVSGRGVGLDVVTSQVEAIHGRVRVASTPGRGTRFTLSVPLTLGMIRALLVGCAGGIYAVPQASVERVLRVRLDELRRLGGQETITLRDAGGRSPRHAARFARGGTAGEQVVRVFSLDQVLGLRRTAPDDRTIRPAFVVAAGERRALYVVDELIAEREIVVKGMGRRIRRLRFTAGLTTLPDGRVAPILHAADLVEGALAAGARIARPEPAPRAKPRIVFAEDSVTTRTLVKSILEQSGYDVLAAADGEEAWGLLQEHGADAIVTDIQMPRMDGFDLTRAVRGTPRFVELPVVLVTALADESDRLRGLEAGADAYLVKSAFDQRSLLETLGRLIGGGP